MVAGLFLPFGSSDGAILQHHCWYIQLVQRLTMMKQAIVDS